MAISNNSLSLRLNNILGNATKDAGKALERLASGSRINRASDDAAGLAIESALTARSKTELTAARNANDGISVANIAESVLSNVSDVNSRLQELAEQAANGTYSDEQRQVLNQEYQALKQEQSRQLDSAEFNGQKLFNSGDIALQVGTGSDSNSQINLPSVNTTSLVTATSIDTADAARAALDDLRSKSDTASSLRSQYGSAVSRVEYAKRNAETSSDENQIAAARIRDADVATEVSNLTSAKIRQNATTGLAAQANLTAAQVLELLK